MGENTEVSGLKITCTELEFTLGKTVGSMKVNMLTTKSTDTEFITG